MFEKIREKRKQKKEKWKQEAEERQKKQQQELEKEREKWPLLHKIVTAKVSWRLCSWGLFSGYKEFFREGIVECEVIKETEKTVEVAFRPEYIRSADNLVIKTIPKSDIIEVLEKETFIYV